MNQQLIRIRRGGLKGMTGTVKEITADDMRVRLTSTGRYLRIPRDGGWFEDVPIEPLTAAQMRSGNDERRNMA